MSGLKSHNRLTRKLGKKIVRFFSVVVNQYNLNSLKYIKELLDKWNTRLLQKSIMSIFVLCTFAMYIVFQGGQLPSLATADYLEVKSFDDGYIPLDNIIMDEEDELAGRFKYVIKPGDTLIGIAQEFGITTKQVVKINNLKSEKIIPGQEIVISEIDGIVYEIPGNISLKDFASKYGIDKEDIKQLNFIQNDNDILKKGNQLFLGLTVEEAQTVGLIKKDEPVETIRPTRNQSNHPKARTRSEIIQRPINNGGIQKPKLKTSNLRRFIKKVKDSFGFVPGHCTWYVAQKRPDIFTPGETRPFGGNAKAWSRNAKAAGYGVGKSPKVGSVAVMPGVSGYGHVGIVIDIDDDGVLVESMNYKGRYIVSRDRIDSAQISSYIY